MKNLILFIAFSFIIIGCGKKNGYDLSDIKENDASRKLLFAAIINDKEMLSYFLDELGAHENGINQLLMDHETMKHIFDLQNMYFLAQEKPDIMLMMFNNLAHITGNDTSVHRMMMNLPKMQQIMREKERDFARK